MKRCDSPDTVRRLPTAAAIREQERVDRAALRRIMKEIRANAVPVAKQSRMRRFVLERAEDLTGTSGTGVVAEGVVFSNGHVAYSWISPLATVTTCLSVDVVERLHGHEGRTTVRFLD